MTTDYDIMNERGLEEDMSGRFGFEERKIIGAYRLAEGLLAIAKKKHSEENDRDELIEMASYMLYEGLVRCEDESEEPTEKEKADAKVTEFFEDTTRFFGLMKDDEYMTNQTIKLLQQTMMEQGAKKRHFDSCPKVCPECKSENVHAHRDGYSCSTCEWDIRRY